MCFFLTIVVRNEQAEMKRLIPRGFMLHGPVKHHLQQELSANLHCFLLTTGMCSCDLFRRPSDVDDVNETPEIRTNDRRKKFAKRGWSESKVARVVADAMAHTEPDTDFVGLRPDVRELLATIAEQIGGLSIFVQMYNGDLATEKVVVDHRMNLRSLVLRTGEISISENVLFNVVV